MQGAYEGRIEDHKRVQQIASVRDHLNDQIGEGGSDLCMSR
jgi:hypothetical protein